MTDFFARYLIEALMNNQAVLTSFGSRGTSSSVLMRRDAEYLVWLETGYRTEQTSEGVWIR